MRGHALAWGLASFAAGAERGGERPAVVSGGGAAVVVWADRHTHRQTDTPAVSSRSLAASLSVSAFPSGASAGAEAEAPRR